MTQNDRSVDQQWIESIADYEYAASERETERPQGETQTVQHDAAKTAIPRPDAANVLSPPRPNPRRPSSGDELVDHRWHAGRCSCSCHTLVVTDVAGRIAPHTVLAAPGGVR